jgi:hypothetical protein
MNNKTTDDLTTLIAEALSLLLASLSQDDASQWSSAEELNRSALRLLRSALPDDWQPQNDIDGWHLEWALALDPTKPIDHELIEELCARGSVAHE